MFCFVFIQEWIFSFANVFVLAFVDKIYFVFTNHLIFSQHFLKCASLTTVQEYINSVLREEKFPGRDKLVKRMVNKKITLGG